MRTRFSDAKSRRQLTCEVASTGAVRIEVDVVCQCLLDSNPGLEPPGLGVDRCSKCYQAAIGNLAQDAERALCEHATCAAGACPRKASAFPRPRNSHNR